jgi:hypothetical protein
MSERKWTGDPVFHGRLSDGLPETHPLANETVSCVRCNRMVHAWNNEMMEPWVEFQWKALCWPCFHTTHGPNSDPPNFDAFGFDD